MQFFCSQQRKSFVQIKTHLPTKNRFGIEEKGTISWRIKFRNGHEKNFVSPITTKPWGKHIPKLAEEKAPTNDELNSQLLYSEPTGLNIDTGLPKIKKEKFKEGVYY